MTSDDLTVQILTDIRDEIRTTNLRLDRVRDDLGQRVDHLRDDLGQRIDQTNARISESEIRTSTALHDLIGTVRDVRDLFKDRLELRDRIDRCERDIEDLKHRVG